MTREMSHEDQGNLNGGTVSEIHTVVLCDTDGVLTDGTVFVDSNGIERLTFHKRDGWLLAEAAEAGIKVVVITMDPNPHPSRHRALKMGCEHIATTSPEGKAEAVRQFKAEGKRVVYIGDSPQDLLAMREADEALCPKDAHEWTLDEWARAKITRLRAGGGGGVLYEVLSALLAKEAA